MKRGADTSLSPPSLSVKLDILIEYQYQFVKSCFIFFRRCARCLRVDKKYSSCLKGTHGLVGKTSIYQCIN